MSRRIRKENLAFLIFFLVAIFLVSIGFLVTGLALLNDTAGDGSNAQLFVGVGMLGLISTVVNAVRYWPKDGGDR